MVLDGVQDLNALIFSAKLYFVLSRIRLNPIIKCFLAKSKNLISLRSTNHKNPARKQNFLFQTHLVQDQLWLIGRNLLDAYKIVCLVVFAIFMMSNSIANCGKSLLFPCYLLEANFSLLLNSNIMVVIVS